MNHGFMARALSGEREARKQKERKARKKLEDAAPALLAACEDFVFLEKTNMTEKQVQLRIEIAKIAITKAKQ